MMERRMQMAVRSRRGSKGDVIEVDFTGTESGPKILPEGEYSAEVYNFEKKKSDNSGKYYLAWEFRVVDETGEYEGVRLHHNTTLQEQGLFNLKNLLDAIGIDTDGKIQFTLEQVKGAMVNVAVDTETYQGKKKSKIVGIYPFSEEDNPEDKAEED